MTVTERLWVVFILLLLAFGLVGCETLDFIRFLSHEMRH